MFGLKNILPETMSGRLLGGFGVSTLLGFGFTFAYSMYHRSYTEPYKKSVCWDHYTKYYNEAMRVVSMDRYEMNVRRAEYKSCLTNARSGKKIYPPTIV